MIKGGNGNGGNPPGVNVGGLISSQLSFNNQVDQQQDHQARNTQSFAQLVDDESQ